MKSQLKNQGFWGGHWNDVEIVIKACNRFPKLRKILQDALHNHQIRTFDDLWRIINDVEKGKYGTYISTYERELPKANERLTHQNP